MFKFHPIHFFNKQFRILNNSAQVLVLKLFHIFFTKFHPIQGSKPTQDRVAVEIVLMGEACDMNGRRGGRK